MAIIRVTKKFSFEMAHALWNYDGACSNIHGHSYTLSVTLAGEPIKDPGNPKNGMVVDFVDIKKWVKKSIIEPLDHSLLISKEADRENISASKQMFSRLKLMDFQPTCENLLIFMAETIRKQLPGNIKLHSLKLRETDTSFAEWYAEDNP